MRTNKGKWIARALLFRVAMIAIMSAAVMLLWNAIVVDLFGLQLIGYFQSLGLLLLVRILSGRFGPGGQYGPAGMMHKKGLMHDHWKKMKEEEKEQWINRINRDVGLTDMDEKGQ
jgi:hypothetical protein